MLTGSLHIFANSIFLCGTLEAINISEPSKYTQFQNNNSYTGRDAETNRNTANEIKEAGGEDEHGNDSVEDNQLVAIINHRLTGLAWAFQCDVSKREEVAEMARYF